MSTKKTKSNAGRALPSSNDAASREPGAGRVDGQDGKSTCKESKSIEHAEKNTSATNARDVFNLASKR